MRGRSGITISGENRNVTASYKAADDAPEQTKWLVSVLNRDGLNYTEFSRRIHITKQTVAYYVNSDRKIQFVYIAAICWAFHLDDDPELVWKKIEADWKERGKK